MSAAITTDRGPMLEVRDLSVEFRTRHGRFRALDGVSLSIGVGESVGLVGESGSGKTTLGRSVLGLVAAQAGSIHLAGEDVTRADRKTRRRLARTVQAVFQDPYGSLNPALPVRQSLLEAMPGDVPKAEVGRRLTEMLARVGLAPSTAEKYPSGFSGGQRQRIAIARALMPQPRLVICDEPVSALDVSVQAQVLNLLKECQRDLGLSYLFIGHDLEVVRYMSDRIVVMYRGMIVEEGPADEVAERPRHPYTQALVSSAPRMDRGQPTAPPVRVRSEEPAVERGAGCQFAPRCPFAVDRCRTTVPALEPFGDSEIRVACHRAAEISELVSTLPQPHQPPGTARVVS